MALTNFRIEDFDASKGDGDRPDCAAAEDVAIEGYDPATDPENLALEEDESA